MEMNREPKPKPVRTLWMYIREGLRQANARRPISFYLLLAMPIVLLLGVNLLTPAASPKRFTFFLGLFFVFFGAIMLRAIIDFFEIARKHFSEHEKIFRTTLGDHEFLSQMAARTNEPREK
jgi:hypothetical protein